MYRVIFLDIDDTLLDFTACASDAMRRGLAMRNVAYRPEMYPVFERITLSLWRQIEDGKMSRQEVFAVRWTMVFEALGLDLDGPAFEEDFRLLLTESAFPVPHALEVLAYLSEKYTLCTASNGPQGQQEERLRRAGMLHYFRHVFTSGAIGSAKPGRDFFDRCFTMLPGVAPREALIIGDSPTADIAGGIAYGMGTCWFNPKNRPCPPELRPDYTVTDLCQLMTLL